MSRSPDLSPGRCAQLACILEVGSEKPGNVTPRRRFGDASHEDFVLAAGAIVTPLDEASRTGVGQAVLESIQRTRTLVRTNVNLGLVLLLAPLSAAAGKSREPLDRARVKEVLAALTPLDGERVYQAIQLARPGGLGDAPEEDVTKGPPSRSLVRAMTLARKTDLVACQYANDFEEVFDQGVRWIEEGVRTGLALEETVALCHLRFMAHHPDSLIARKCGIEVARDSARRARSVLTAGWPGSREAREALTNLDRWLREDGHRKNPGTSADLVGASLFLAMWNGIITFPHEGKI